MPQLGKTDDKFLGIIFSKNDYFLYTMKFSPSFISKNPLQLKTSTLWTWPLLIYNQFLITTIMTRSNNQKAHSFNKLPYNDFQIFNCSPHKVSESCSVVSDSATPGIVAYWAPQSLELSRQEYWSGL